MFFTLIFILNMLSKIKRRLKAEIKELKEEKNEIINHYNNAIIPTHDIEVHLNENKLAETDLMNSIRRLFNWVPPTKH